MPKPVSNGAVNRDSQVSVVRVGRQAIFDRDLNVYAYELLYRGTPSANSEFDGDVATSSTLLNSFMNIGIDRLTGGRPAFINLTRSFFTEFPSIPFDKDQVVLEILEDIPVDEKLIQAVKNLHEQGYQVAIDDYLFESKWQPLLPYVSLIKVEIREQDLPNMEQLLAPLKQRSIKLLAEKVETHEQFRTLHQAGFDLFQGYFFARPDIVQENNLEENRAVLLNLLAKVNNPSAEIADISDLISQDPALSFKVLRFINSPAVGLRKEIDSIHQAVVLLGLARIRAWATLFSLAGEIEKPAELLNLGLFRANLCEKLCRLSNPAGADTAYTVGLLSILDGMLSMPMDKLLADLPLPQEIAEAISQQQGPFGELLSMAIQMEKGHFQLSGEYPVSEEQLFDIFLESSELAFAGLNQLSAN